jgi:MYXO-CTERM domain-containing protein
MKFRTFALGLGALALAATPALAQQAATYNQPFEDSSAISGWYQNTYGYPLYVTWAVDASPEGGRSAPNSLNLGTDNGLDNVDEAYGYIETTDINCSGLNSAVFSFWCRADIGNINNMYWYGRELQMYSNSYWNYWRMGDSGYDLNCGTDGEWHQHQVSIDPSIINDGSFRLTFYIDLGLYGEGNGRDGWFIDDLQILVADVTPPDAINDLVASNPTLNQVQLTWTSPFDDDVSGVTANFDLRFSTSPINATNFNSATPVGGEPAPDVEGTTHTVIVPGLTEDTTYYFAIQTTDIAGNVSLISNVASASTLAPPPPPPTTGGITSAPSEVEIKDDILPCSAGSNSAPTGMLALAGLIALAAVAGRVRK